MRLSLLALCLCGFLPQLPATAQQADVTGAWSFQTDIKRKGCTITGNMTISVPATNGTRTCSFVSTETCQAVPDQAWQIDQTCRVTPQDENLIIRSQVKGSLTEGYNVANYLPDHFVVRPENSQKMTGIWQDSAFSAPVIFWRDDALPVS